MSKKKTVIKSLVTIGVITLLAGIYLGLSLMYSGGFAYGTWINGEYCTGKSVATVNELLKTYNEKPVIVVSDMDGNINYIYSEEYDYNTDYTDELNYISSHQNPFLWIRNIFKDKSEHNIEPVKTIDSEKLATLVSRLPIYEKYLNMEEATIKIVSDSKGYRLLDTSHELLDYDRITKAVLDIATEGGVLYISDDFLYNEEPTLEEIKVKQEWEKLQSFLSTKIVYDMGAEQIPVDSEVLRTFLKTDENGMYQVDEKGLFILNDDSIISFVQDLCVKYDTTTLPRKYTTYKGKEIEINFQLKATRLDEEKEKAYLLEAVHNSLKEVHVPAYLQEGFVRGQNDVGDSFIEVDLTEQKLYFVKDGSLLLETDIVSGNPNKGWTTPKMLCYIYAKSEDVVLKGEGYASPVDYWMPVYKGIGLHDASWQSSFGSDLYLTRGSRGCINLYIDDAKTVYDNSYVGIPVIIY